VGEFRCRLLGVAVSASGQEHRDLRVLDPPGRAGVVCAENAVRPVTACVLMEQSGLCGWWPGIGEDAVCCFAWRTRILRAHDEVHERRRQACGVQLERLACDQA
jgi:hypothetical protein